MSKEKDDIVLINESRRSWSFPALPMPGVELVRRTGSDRPKVPPKLIGQTESGHPIYSSVELETVPRFRPAILRAPALAQDGSIDETKDAPRITVPRWYFELLLKIKTLRPVFGRKRDGIAVGRTRAEIAADRDSDQRNELEAAQKEIAQLRSDLEKARARESAAKK